MQGDPLCPPPREETEVEEVEMRLLRSLLNLQHGGPAQHVLGLKEYLFDDWQRTEGPEQTLPGRLH